jgi:hypothetical protein
MSTLTKSIHKIGKTNGIYLKSFSSSLHHLYIAFTKPRYTTKFIDAFDCKRVSGLEQGVMFDIAQVGRLRRDAKAKAVEISDVEQGIIKEIGEVLTKD